MGKRRPSLQSFLHKEVLKSRIKPPSNPDCENTMSVASELANPGSEEGTGWTGEGGPSTITTSKQPLFLETPPSPTPHRRAPSVLSPVGLLREELKALVFREIDAAPTEKEQLKAQRIDLIKRLTRLEDQEQKRKDRLMRGKVTFLLFRFCPQFN